MVEFNKLLVLPCNRGLYIDCNILDLPYFENVYIDKVIIDNQNTYTLEGPSSTPIYSAVIEGNQKKIQLTISSNDLLIDSDSVFFVYVVTKGTPRSDIPCGLDNSIVVESCVDTYSIYRQALKYIKDECNRCEPSLSFIDFILRFKAFQLALKTKDFLLAIKYWRRFINQPSITKTNNCRCHG